MNFAKKYKALFLLTFLPIFTVIPEDLQISKSYRGIRFFPATTQTVHSMTITVPKIAERFDLKHVKDNFPITFFKADCIEKKNVFRF